MKKKILKTLEPILTIFTLLAMHLQNYLELKDPMLSSKSRLRRIKSFLKNLKNGKMNTTPKKLKLSIGTLSK